MVSDSDFQKAVELINKSNNVLITTHTRPDGDACGSMVALRRLLLSLGKQVNLILLSPLPKWYEFLFEEKVPILGSDLTPEQLTAGSLGDFDLVIITDTNSFSQLPRFDKYLKQAKGAVLVIDHHKTTDGLGNVELIDTTAAASGQIVLDLFKYAGWPISKKIAEVLFVAISTDTGWFRFNNADSRVYRDVAELVDAGAEPGRVYARMYQNFSPARLKLMTAMLDTLELHFDGRFATQYILRNDFERTGARGADTENLIDECQRISTIRTAALFVELKDGGFRCSLRSKGDIDVRRIAEKFGGGGHTAAAGVNLPGPLENAIGLIKAEVEKQF